MEFDLKQWLTKNQISQAAFARALGVSAAVISQHIKGCYKGDVVELVKKINVYVGNYRRKTVSSDTFVMTDDAKMIAATIDEAITHSSVAVIYGKAGYGKTAAVKRKLEQHPEAVLIEAIPSMTVKTLRTQLCNRLGVKDACGTNDELFYIALNRLKKSGRFLVIDEAENLNTSNLETIRRLADFAEAPVVYVGTYALMQNLKGRRGELLQIYSRAMEKWELQGLSDGDRTKLFGSFGGAIAKYCDDVRRGTGIFRKAERLAGLAEEPMTHKFIDMAAQSVILD